MAIGFGNINGAITANIVSMYVSLILIALLTFYSTGQVIGHGIDLVMGLSLPISRLVSFARSCSGYS